MFVRTTDGTMGSVDLSWSINKDQPAYISIYGVDGTLEVGWRESRYRRSTDAEWTVFGTGYDKHNTFCAIIDNFARSLQDIEPLMISARDALASVVVIESAYKSLHSSAWQKVAS